MMASVDAREMPGDLPACLGRVRGEVLRAIEPSHLIAESIGGSGPAPGAIVAIGKAAGGMHAGATAALGDVETFMIAPEGAAAPEWARRADHPVPTSRNLKASGELERFVVDRAHAEASLLVLISGGASALLASPADGLSLDDLQVLTRRLLACGATIQEINTVRKHVERLKGGGLARAANPSRVEALIISDVIGDDPTFIGSGPVSPDPTTFVDAIGVLDRHGLGGDDLARVRAHLEGGARGEIPETPKPGDALFDRVSARVIAGNGTAVAGAREACEREGFRVLTTEGVEGEAAEVGRRVARDLWGSAPGTALVVGGETTVTLGDCPGRGGRNQEFALAGAIEMECLAGQSGGGAARAAMMAFATDGVDGPTDAAGALVTAATGVRARALGLDLAASLAAHDSYSVLDEVGALIRTGPTGTNVADLIVGLRL